MDFSTYFLQLLSRSPKIPQARTTLPHYGPRKEPEIGGEAPALILGCGLFWASCVPLAARESPAEVFHVPAILMAAYAGWYLLQVRRVKRNTWLRWAIISLLFIMLSAGLVTQAWHHAEALGRQDIRGKK